MSEPLLCYQADSVMFRALTALQLDFCRYDWCYLSVRECGADDEQIMMPRGCFIS